MTKFLILVLNSIGDDEWKKLSVRVAVGSKVYMCQYKMYKHLLN